VIDPACFETFGISGPSLPWSIVAVVVINSFP